MIGQDRGGQGFVSTEHCCESAIRHSPLLLLYHVFSSFLSSPHLLYSCYLISLLLPYPTLYLFLSPLSGTITANSADVWSYASDEDTLVLDPLLPQHLSHWGIDIMRLEKTDKSMTEMEVALNMKVIVLSCCRPVLDCIVLYYVMSCSVVLYCDV